MSESETLIEACPACDDPNFYARAGEQYSESERYRCRNCGHVFESPLERPPLREKQGRFGEISRALMDAEPGDLVTDGGVQGACERAGCELVATHRFVVDLEEIVHRGHVPMYVCPDHAATIARDWHDDGVNVLEAKAISPGARDTMGGRQ
jgi:predicted RNA-binding Zn-ribbon protein involved in translation (DUF1610 family)